jgi:hypothetical protein
MWFSGVAALLLLAGETSGTSWETDIKVFKDRTELGLAVGTRVGGLSVASRLGHKSNATLNRDQRERKLTARGTGLLGWDPMSVVVEGWRSGDRAPGHRHRVSGLELKAEAGITAGVLSLQPGVWWLREKTTVERGPGRSDTNHGGGGSLRMGVALGQGDVTAQVEQEAREETSRQSYALEYGARGTAVGWTGRLHASAEAETRGYPLAGGEQEHRDLRWVTGKLEGERTVGHGARLAASLSFSGQEASYEARPEGGYDKLEASWWARVVSGVEGETFGELTVEQGVGQDRYRRSLSNRRLDSGRLAVRCGHRGGMVQVEGSAEMSLDQQFYTSALNPDDHDQAVRAFRLKALVEPAAGVDGSIILGYRNTRLVYPDAARSAASTRRRLYEIQPGMAWSSVSGFRVEGSLALRADYNLFRFRGDASTLARGTTAVAKVEVPFGSMLAMLVTVRSSRQDEGTYYHSSYGRRAESREVEATAAILRWRPHGILAEPAWGFRRRTSDGWGLDAFTEGRAGIAVNRTPVRLRAEHVWRSPGEDYWEASAGVEGTL